jgi:hypothetical protein
MFLAVKKDEASNPVDVGLFRPMTEVPRPYGAADSGKKFGFVIGVSRGIRHDGVARVR